MMELPTAKTQPIKALLLSFCKDKVLMVLSGDDDEHLQKSQMEMESATLRRISGGMNLGKKKKEKIELYQQQLQIPELSSDDSDAYFTNNKQSSTVCGLLENNVMKSFAADKERANNDAKIKVVVRKRPLNKKELMKNEEDIIETLPTH
nr:kinesin-like protein KIN-13B [Ipomoea batatas]